MEDLRKEGLYNNENILEELKDIYNITSTYSDASMIRKIQRRMREKEFDKAPKSKENAHYYTRDVVEEVLADEDIVKYFGSIRSKKGTYKTNAQLFYEQREELEDRRDQLFKLWEDVGLTEEEGKYLEVDKITNKEYLRADELEFLKKKGMTLRADISDEEKASLDGYNQFLQRREHESEKIDEIFHQKKLEIMITAIFNEHFTLDEEQLYKDIKNSVSGGKYDSVGSTKRKDGKTVIPSQPVRRSYLRLQNGKNYVHKKKTS